MVLIHPRETTSSLISARRAKKETPGVADILSETELQEKRGVHGGNKHELHFPDEVCSRAWDPRKMHALSVSGKEFP